MLVAFHVRTEVGCLCGILNPIHTIVRDWAARSLADPALCSDCVAVLQQELLSVNTAALVDARPERLAGIGFSAVCASQSSGS